MKYRFAELIDVYNMRGLLDSFCEAVGVASAIIDLDGVVIVESNWQRMCTEFHRANEVTCARCIESDTVLANRLNEAVEHAIYTCKNGLTDAAAPIVLDREHIANFFVGQFFLTEPDTEFFRKQGREFGFDEEEYLRAMREIPIISEDRLGPILNYLSQFARTLAELGLKEMRRMRAEETVRENEARLSNILDNSATVVSLKDLAGKYLLINRRYEELFHISKDAIIGKTDFDIFPEDVAKVFQAQDRRALKEGEAITIEEEMPHDDGLHTYISVKFPLLRSDSEPYGVCGVATDITERKQAEEARRESEELYRKAIEVTGSVPYYQNYVTGKYEFVGEGISELLGCHPEEFDYQLWMSIVEEVVLKGDLAGMPPEEAVEKAKSREGMSWCADYRIRTRQGEERWIANVAVQVLDDAGSLVGSLGILRDITEQKEAEEERERLEAQLRQSQKMEAVGQLAGGIAHDFNNILQGIIGYTEMARSGLSPDVQAYQDMEQVLKGAGRAATLTRQLLAFSRRQMIKPVNLDLSEVVTGLSKMLHRVIGEHIELELDLGADTRTVRADPGTLEQVLMNLCVNARDAMPSGGQLVIQTEHVVLDDAFCETHLWAEPGHYALLSVTDTGVGMPPDVVAHVFEPFFTTKETGKGTGLGLSMVYGIVKQHGGLTHCYSEPSRGTCFKIYLPSVERIAATNQKAEDTSAAQVGGTETILLAEDDEMVRNIAVLTLESGGYRVLVAKDGEEALRLFEEHLEDIQFALLDVVMPKVGGREVSDTIRAFKPCLPVLFSSGYSTSAIHAGFVVEEGLETIQKPYSPNALLRKIREVLDAG